MVCEVEVHYQNKDPKHLIFYPLTLAHWSLGTKTATVPLFPLNLIMKHCTWWQNDSTMDLSLLISCTMCLEITAPPDSITEFDPACGGWQKAFHDGHFPIVMDELAGKSLGRAHQSHWSNHSHDIRLASDCTFVRNVAMELEVLQESNISK